MHGYGRGLRRGSQSAGSVSGRRGARALHLVATRYGRSAVCQEALLFAAVACDVANGIESTYN